MPGDNDTLTPSPAISSDPPAQVPGTERPERKRETGELRRSWQDRSGTIPTPAAAFVVAEENAQRRALLIQNQGAHTMWVDFDQKAVAGVPALEILKDGDLDLSLDRGDFVPTGRVTIIGTAGESFAAREA